MKQFFHPLKILAITEFFLLCAEMKPRAFKICVKRPEVTPDPRTTVPTSLPRPHPARVPAAGGAGAWADLLPPGSQRFHPGGC